MLSVRLPVPRFVSAGEVFSGVGSIGVLRALPAARVAVLASSSLLQDSVAGDKLRAAVRAQDVRFIAAPKGEPSLDTLQPVITEITEFGPDWIVAAGGGSVLDGAKIAWAFYEQPDLDPEEAVRPFALPRLRGRARLVAVPTTSGSGSEVSSAAVFAVHPHHAKKPMVSHELLPDVVILDPALTMGVPSAVRIAAGFDALAHAVEGYASRFDNSLVDLLAEQAVRTLLRELPRSIAEPQDMDARLNVMNAAMMAGWVQNLKVPGAGHAIAHQLAELGIGHGAATGFMLVPALRYNCRDETVRSKYDRLAEAVGLAGADALMDKITQMRRDLAVPNPMTGKRIADRDGLLAAALEDVCARANPRPLDCRALDEILDDAICAA
ncbi:iron-containing alcohol dehydrogenase [Rhizorhapis sp. SPR117]|uniref:iron-containing alcohol dehydrogenase n=1 Tax=Rhizorhapis sp. SPR117 TaxID=2912611 RepID=UPI001F21345F|nr:iron-containing alcohol dehydrogenase [Rhizorhapis sp. SPR117]